MTSKSKCFFAVTSCMFVLLGIGCPLTGNSEPLTVDDWYGCYRLNYDWNNDGDVGWGYLKLSPNGALEFTNIQVDITPCPKHHENVLPGEEAVSSAWVFNENEQFLTIALGCNVFDSLKGVRIENIRGGFETFCTDTCGITGGTWTASRAGSSACN